MVSRLPITIRPAHNEIAVSYLTRLATLHDLPLAGLWSQVSRRVEGRSPRLNAELLATVANQPLHRLASAVVEVRDPEPDWLALRHEPQRGCHRCDARHPGGPVLHLLGHHRYVCTRHRVWIGPPDHPDHPQPSLEQLPEVVTAQHKHLRLLRRRGPAATFDAVLTGFLICAHRWDKIQRALNKDIADTDAWHRWERRTDLLIPPGESSSAFSASRLFAVLYPEAVSLAEVLGSLNWRRLAAGDPDDQRRFAAEIGRRLGQPDYRPRLIHDPIAHWMQTDCLHPPSTPIGNYRTAKTFGGSTFPKPDKRSEQTRVSLPPSSGSTCSAEIGPTRGWLKDARTSGKPCSGLVSPPGRRSVELEPKLGEFGEQLGPKLPGKVTRANSARWFSENHCGGTVIQHHRSLGPVVFRDWAPRMEMFAGALSNTTRVDYGQAERERFGDPVSLARAEFVRQEPAESAFLATAVEPVDWQHRTEPPAARLARP